MFRKLVIAIGIAGALAGCASNSEQIAFEDLQDPKTTPREKWSDAMVVSNAMMLQGLRDIPKELANVGNANAGLSKTNSSSAGYSALSGVTTAALPAGNFSAGLGLGLMMLGGGGTGSTPAPQIVAWVPADKASSTSEAIDLAFRTYQDARSKAFTKISEEPLKALKYPYNDKAHRNGDIIYDGQPTNPPSFIKNKSVYGPIFITYRWIISELLDNGSTQFDSLTKISSNLPDWFYVYLPASKLRKSPLPPIIIHKGEPMHFVGK